MSVSLLAISVYALLVLVAGAEPLGAAWWTGVIVGMTALGFGAFLVLPMLGCSVAFLLGWTRSHCPACGEKQLSKVPRAFAPDSSAEDGRLCRMEWRCFGCGFVFHGTARDRRASSQ